MVCIAWFSGDDLGWLTVANNNSDLPNSQWLIIKKASSPVLAGTAGPEALAGEGANPYRLKPLVPYFPLNPDNGDDNLRLLHSLW
jgi:hypothetical protein